MFNTCAENVKTQVQWKPLLIMEAGRVHLVCAPVAGLFGLIIQFLLLNTHTVKGIDTGGSFMPLTHTVLHVISVLPCLAYPLRGEDGCAHAHCQLKKNKKREREKAVNSIRWEEIPSPKPAGCIYA